MDPIGIQTIKIDMGKKSIIKGTRDTGVPTFVQGDTNRIIFDLYENGVAADLSKVGRAIANFKSGSNVYSQIATVEGSTVVYDLGGNESATVGVADVELQLYNADNTKRVSTMRVKIYLSPAIGEGEISSGNPTYTDLQTLFIEVDEVKTSATGAGAYATAQGDYAKAQGDAVDTKVTAEVTAQVPMAVDEKVGQLASLQTEDKTSVVGAVNEVTEQLAHKASQTDIANAVSPKADKSYVDSTKRDKSIPITLNDASPEMLAAIEGGAGTSFNLESIPRNSSVTPIKTNFFLFGKNLFNPNDPDTVIGGYYTSSGTFKEDPSRGETGYIPISEGANYTTNGVKLSVYWYDENKNYLSFTNATDFSNNGYVTAPSSAKYARFVFSISNYDTYQVEVGTSSTEYEPYKDPKILKEAIPKLDLKDIDNVQITTEMTTFIRESRNIFNPDDPDLVIGGYYTSSGTFTPAADRGQTGYIPVEAGKNYTHNSTLYANVYWYKEDKTYLSLTSFSDFETNKYIVAPANAGFVKIIFYLTDLETYQVEEGTTPTTYEPYGTRFNDYIYLSKAQQNEVEKIVTEKGVTKTYTGKKLMLLGDSITSIGLQDRGWPKYFTEIIENSTYVNVAAAGAWWTDKDGTVYDGNPVTNGADNNLNNVLGNQVQKIINDAYEEPDIIMIAAGTNDAELSGYTLTDEQIEAEFFSNGAVVPLANANRKNFAGAIRYVVEKLRELYPNAQIFLCTPLQRYSTTESSYPAIKQKGDLIKKIAQRLSVPVIDSQESGVYGLYAENGVASGDFNDGLHLSPTGARKVGEYNARKIINWFCF